MIDWTIVSARFLEFTSVLILFGSSLFYLYAFSAGSGEPSARRWAWPHRLLIIASIIALVSVISWLFAETVSLTGDPNDALSLAALWSVVSDTHFGKVAFLRIVLLVCSTVTLFACPSGRALWVMQSLLGGVVLASFAWSGHGATNEGLAGVIHLGGDVLHLLAAGVWVGALLPLSILILHSLRTQTDPDARLTYESLEKFSGVGIAVVSVLIVTGLINSWFLIGLAHWRSLFTTLYGISLLAKLALFGLMLLFATANRFVLSPRLGEALLRPAPQTNALRPLRASILVETTIALLVLAAVALLGTLEPPIAVL